MDALRGCEAPDNAMHGSKSRSPIEAARLTGASPTAAPAWERMPAVCTTSIEQGQTGSGPSPRGPNLHFHRTRHP